MKFKKVLNEKTKHDLTNFYKKVTDDAKNNASPLDIFLSTPNDEVTYDILSPLADEFCKEYETLDKQIDSGRLSYEDGRRAQDQFFDVWAGFIDKVTELSKLEYSHNINVTRAIKAAKNLTWIFPYGWLTIYREYKK